MARIDAGEFGQATSARLGAIGRLASCAVAAMLAATPAAHAALPKVGAWESSGNSEPRVSFDVRGPARSRTVRRVSFPIRCEGSQSPVGWASTDIVRVRAGRRFTAFAFQSVIRGRFTAKNRAEVTVRSSGTADCEDNRRYVVLRRGPRVAVRNGSYLSLVRGGGAVGLETSAFGRMARVEYMEGSIAGSCSDGSQRPLTLAGPEGLILAAPIRPDGRFDIFAAVAGSSIKIAGTFDGGSVAAYVDLSVVLSDGMPCTATTQPLVGSLASPLESGGENEVFPSPPVIIRPPAPLSRHPDE